MFSPIFYLAFTMLVIVGTCSAVYTTEQTSPSPGTDLAELINCSFDFDLCNWNISVDDGGSNQTSPSWEIRKDEKGRFLWIPSEDAVHQLPHGLGLRSPLFTSTENTKVCLHFQYRLFGSDNGVTVSVFNSRYWYYDRLATLRSTGNIWRHMQKEITVGVYPDSYSLQFLTSRGRTGGIALNDVSVVKGKCPDEDIEQLSASYHERQLRENLAILSELLGNQTSVYLVSAIAHASALKGYSEYREMSGNAYSILADFRKTAIKVQLLDSILEEIE